MAKIVIDANVLISAAFGGTPLDAVAKAFAIGTVFVSPQVVTEIEATMRLLAPKLGEERTRSLVKLWSGIRGRCVVVEPQALIRICRDPKDDAYLALCVAAKAEVLITGDKDLLVVDITQASGLPRALRILTPRQFLDMHG